MTAATQRDRTPRPQGYRDAAPATQRDRRYARAVENDPPPVKPSALALLIANELAHDDRAYYSHDAQIMSWAQMIHRLMLDAEQGARDALEGREL